MKNSLLLFTAVLSYIILPLFLLRGWVYYMGKNKIFINLFRYFKGLFFLDLDMLLSVVDLRFVELNQLYKNKICFFSNILTIIIYLIFIVYYLFYSLHLPLACNEG